jgi:PAS domain S-box-containing protein
LKSELHLVNGKTGQRRQNLFLFLVFLLLSAGISLTGYFYFRKIEENQRRETGHTLTAIADLKVAQITAWRRERLGDAQVVAENRLLREDLAACLQGRLSASRQDDAVQWMRSLSRAYGYSAAMLFDSNVRPAIIVPGQPGLPESTDIEIARRVMRERRVFLSDLYQTDRAGQIHMDLAIPILATAPGDSPAIGALVIRIDPQNFIYPLIQGWPEPSASAESLLVRRDGDTVLFLNDLRHRKDSALRFRHPMNQAQRPAVQAVLGRTGIMEGIDYRGVQVMAALQPVPGTPWFLVCKVDAEEVFVPLRERSFLLLALAVVLVLACGAGLGIVNSRQTTLIYRRQEEQMAEYRRRLEQTISETNALLKLFVHAASREEYLRQSLELIGGWVGAESVGFRVFDAAGQVREEPFRGFDPEFWRLSSPHRGRADCCSCLQELLAGYKNAGSRWLTSGGSLRIDDLESETARSFLGGVPGTPCSCREYGYRGLAIVPIRTQERVAGTLHLASREAGEPTAESVQLLENLAPILAEAIVRFEIGEELQQHRDHLEEMIQLRTRELATANDQLRREIVERERMEKELLELERLRILADSRKEWQETFDAITDLISIHDTDFVVRKANRAFLDHFGLSAEDVTRHHCYELFHEGACPVEGCPQCTQPAAANPVSREVADPKTGRVFLVSTYPLRRAQGEPGGLIHIARDVTGQKDQEMKMILSERLASLGQMAAGIAHEINNPLATIGTCAEGLLRRLTEGREDPALLRDYLGIIEEEVRRCQTITSGMLSFVRQDRGNRAPLDVHELIDKTLALVGYQGRLRDVEVVRDFDDAPLRVRASEGGLRQVLLTLVVNALDAMEDRGTLTVSAASTDGKVRISVRDTGPGVAPALQNRIFDLFFTTKSGRGGTGLGLPIAHKIARENGGEISVTSSPGQGATFTLILPAN